MLVPWVSSDIPYLVVASERVPELTLKRGPLHRALHHCRGITLKHKEKGVIWYYKAEVWTRVT